MNTLDTILIGLLGLFVVYGLRTGIVHMVGSFLGLILGVVLAGRGYEGFSVWIASVLSINPAVAQVFAFGLLMTIVNKLVGLAFSIVDRVVRIVKLFPGIGAIDRLAGAILGLLEGVLVIGITLYLATKVDINPGWTSALQDSILVPIFVTISQIIVPLLPQAWKAAQSII